MLKCEKKQKRSSTSFPLSCIIYTSDNIYLMKTNEEIKPLLHKFILNQCNEGEAKEVVDFFQQKYSSEDIPGVEEVLAILEDYPEMRKEKAPEIYKRIIEIKKVKEKENRRRDRSYWKYAVAAVFLGILLTTYFTRKLLINPNSFESPASEFVTLELPDGKLQVIEGKDSTVVTDSRGNIVGTLKNNQLVYHAETPSASLEYNVITVPYGKKFELSLSDGTHVHLNAGTSLRYPITFKEGEKRQVFLSGEAYFDVARDEAHPFLVNAEALKVQVLGTEFNVASYPESISTEVVLVEGSVGMFVEGDEYQESEETLLKPGFKGSFYKEDQSFSKKEVPTEVYTSWIKGELVFRNMSFQNILKKLERHYNVRIINENQKINGETFNANFGNEPLEKVLEYFNRIYNIKFTHRGDTIYIK